MALTKLGTDGVKDDAITSGKIPANAVGTSEIADDAITQGKIAGGSVDSGKLADQAVTLAKLEHGTSSNDGKFLRANNGADPSFETVTSTNIIGNADNRVITGSGTANTLNGESNVVIDANGRLGIGESSPSTPLHVKHATTNGVAIFESGDADGGIALKDNSTSANVFLLASGNDFYAQTNGAERMRIDSSGKVGIGTGTIRLAEQLHVLGNGIVTSSAENTNMGMFGTFGGSDLLVGTFNTNNVVVRRGNTNVARFTANGFIPNGTDTASANALDDYEQGTYTAQITGQGGGSIALYGNESSLSYTKVGNIVHVHGRIRLYIVNNSMSGQARLSLPFTAASGSNTSNQGQSAVATHGVSMNESSDVGMFLETVGSSSNGYLNITRYSAGWTSVTANQFGGLGATSNHYLAFNHTYQAA